MRFKNHLAVNVPYRPAQWMRGEITPTLAILHDTGSTIKKGRAANYLRENTAKVSVHFVVERDGSFEQQVPINRGANHAGKSSYNGRKHCNNFSIGIEIVNPGPMEAAGPGKSKNWRGKVFDNDEYGIKWVETNEHGGAFWMPHTDAQIKTVIKILSGLFGQIDTLKDVQAHWFVSPGRKVDVNPLFPLEQVRSLILGRTEPLEDDADEVAADVAHDEWVIIETPDDTLNMRRWPSFHPTNVLAAIPDQTPVPLISRGTFKGREWAKVLYAGQEGWVVGRYIGAYEILPSSTSQSCTEIQF